MSLPEGTWKDTCKNNWTLKTYGDVSKLSAACERKRYELIQTDFYYYNEKINYHLCSASNVKGYLEADDDICKSEWAKVKWERLDSQAKEQRRKEEEQRNMQVKMHREFMSDLNASHPCLAWSATKNDDPQTCVRKGVDYIINSTQFSPRKVTARFEDSPQQYPGLVPVSNIGVEGCSGMQHKQVGGVYLRQDSGPLPYRDIRVAPLPKNCTNGKFTNTNADCTLQGYSSNAMQRDLYNSRGKIADVACTDGTCANIQGAPAFACFV